MVTGEFSFEEDGAHLQLGCSEALVPIRRLSAPSDQVEKNIG